MEGQIKFRKNILLKRIIFIAIIIATFFTIFSFSSQDGKKSTGVSYKVTTAIVKTVVKDENASDSWIKKLEPAMRKVAHFSIYTVVGFALMGLFCTFDLQNIKKVRYSFLIGVIYATSDEIHQIFTPKRGPSVFDVGLDSMGVITGIMIMILLIMIIQKKTRFDFKPIHKINAK